MNLSLMLWPVLLVGLVHVGPVQGQDSQEQRPSDASYAYLTTGLLMDPCGIAGEDDWTGDEIRHEIDEALARLPGGVCDVPGMRELLFRTRFLQYALIADSTEPWRVFDIVEAQRQAESLCRDAGCLRQHLIGVEERLLSMSGTALGSSPRTSGFCEAPEPGDAHENGNPLPESVVKMMERQCPGEFMLASCPGEQELLSARCSLGGVSVNGPEWLWRSTADGNSQLLFYSDEGPFQPLASSCNGLPDIRTSVRANMGESHVTYYRYDGLRYQAVIAYIRESIGIGAIARYPHREASVTCE